MECNCTQGYKIHLKAKDVFIIKQADTMDATAMEEDIKAGTTAYSKNVKREGSMPVNPAQSIEFTEKGDSYAIPMGYHDGEGVVSIADEEIEKIISQNIAEDVSILGTQGELPRTDDATATEDTVLDGSTFYAQGEKKTGLMPNCGAVILTIDSRDDMVPIPEGYHNGSGFAKIADSEREKIIPEHILKDVEILGQVGTVVRKTNDRLADYINGTLENIDLSGDEINDIRDYMFYNNRDLRSVEFPNTFTSIGSYAFGGCSYLNEVILPTTLGTIGTAAFMDCLFLTNIDLPEGLNTISSSAFRNTRISKIWIPSSVSTIYASSNTNSPFYSCSALTDIYCEAEYQPSGYGSYWNYTGSNTRATVHWGVSREEYDGL